MMSISNYYFVDILLVQLGKLITKPGKWCHIMEIVKIFINQYDLTWR